MDDLSDPFQRGLFSGSVTLIHTVSVVLAILIVLVSRWVVFTSL